MTTAVVTSLNGRIPTNLLTVVDAAGHQLRPDAADALARLSDGMTAARIGPLVLTAGASAYRTRTDQQHMRDIALTTIPVGQSIHGEALAADLDNLGGYGGARHAWLRGNAARFGWYQPSWARQGGVLPEPWHWEYDPDLDQHAPTITPPTPLTEDDMSAAGEAAIIAALGDIASKLAYLDKRFDNVESVLAIEDTGLGAGGIRGDVRTVHTLLQETHDWVGTVADETRAVTPRVVEGVASLLGKVSTTTGVVDYAAIAKAVNDDEDTRTLNRLTK